MLSFADSIKNAIMKYGVVKLDTLEIFAYEVNGKG
jgi:meiotically up-regulated gene 157 (Mug157) protein